MESPEKFTNSKEVIAFLAETFPKCFSIEGEARPLKIGIFQDLAERLEEDERVSKHYFVQRFAITPTAGVICTASKKVLIAWT